MASSSTSFVPKSFKYDVFLSFRGEDTRTNFIDHLYYALQQKNIYTYKDDEQIKKGKRISDELIGSIEDLKFHIIVFSKNYVSSSWCLEELVKIMELHKETEHTAYPIFYDVEPSEVRKQSGAVGEAFSKYEKEEAAGKWRKALKEVANLAGWELKKTSDGHEAKFIKKIVEEVSLELRSINFSIDEKLVGMETRIKDVLSSLGATSYDVCMIGIKGMGGGGKTTLARAVFDQIACQFEGRSFVENVREVSNVSLSGLKSLQSQVLSDILNDQGIHVSSVYDGKNMIKRMVRGRKVLVVLDDVDHIDQLEALAGDPTWFKPGSIVIITTRDEQVLVAHGVKLIHNVNLLLDKEAICLFSRYAFGREIPIQGYEELSWRVVRYAAGLPLTIRVLGSFLCGKNELEWIDALERLKTIPLTETLKKLELSYIGLEEDYKEMFLDVACILKGRPKDHAIKVLESCGFHARNGLRVLEQKSLITINDISGRERVSMHDHVEEMGRNIVRRSHPNMPCKHSRLWTKEEIEDILVNDLGTEATRCMRFYMWRVNTEIVMKGLQKMKELRLLDVSLKLTDESKRDCFRRNWELHKFPNTLQYLRWHNGPFTSLPKISQKNNLVAHGMVPWGGGERKILTKLRFLDLSYPMLRTLDLGLTPNLETLTLGRCGDLVELHMPVACIKLRFFHISDSNLRTLDLGSAPNLELLHLDKCWELVELRMPGRCLNLRSFKLKHSKLRTLDLGSAPNLELLDVDECWDLIELYLPGGCLHLRSLKLEHSKVRILDIGMTPNLEYLGLKNCYDFEELHMAHECQKLTSLHVSHSKLRILNLGLTPNLEKLDLGNCFDLEELHMANECQKLTSLYISHSKLKTLDLGLTPNVERLDLNECYNLVELHVPIGCLKKLVYLNLSGCLRFRSFVFKINDCSVDESLEVSLLAELHLIAESLERCPIHPDNNLPKFQFTCFYKDDLPSLTRNLEKLVSFGLCSCTNLEEFSASICGLQRLRKLKLKGGIPEAPKDLDQLGCLENLIFSSTKIKHLPDNICLLKHLKSLKLKSCWLIEKLPENLGHLECLEKLTLSSTMVNHLPDSICMLKHLKSLKLIFCWLLEKLPEHLGQLECLQKVTLSSAKIKYLPYSICMLKNLKSLKLKYCWLLERLPEDFGRLKCLEKLTLSSTKIRYLPDSICMLKHLGSIELNHCTLLQKLPEDLGQLECLKELILMRCTDLRVLPNSICKMKCLKHFLLRYCIRVEGLPEEIGHLRCLKELDIEGTCISHLPQSILLLKGLHVLGSRALLQSFGLTSEIQTSEDERICYIKFVAKEGLLLNQVQKLPSSKKAFEAAVSQPPPPAAEEVEEKPKPKVENAPVMEKPKLPSPPPI
ncbi:unnamed protein product [Lactuca saligna]|uniref:TIR domain-containing protein n=1 Tax=Lactuca saligna TaxID=75948 RepID=A0AA35YRP4_LACSI|nr:unnamed protein product [Lactuca saligna]